MEAREVEVGKTYKLGNEKRVTVLRRWMSGGVMLGWVVAPEGEYTEEHALHVKSRDLHLAD